MIHDDHTIWIWMDYIDNHTVLHEVTKLFFVFSGNKKK